MPRHPAPPPPLPPWGQPAPHLVDKARLAMEFEIGAPAVSGWAKKGLPVRDDGLVDLAEVVAWVLRTFDPMNGHATRATAREIQRWLYTLGQERLLIQIAAEHAGAAAYEAATATGLAAHAEALADAVAAEMAARMNPVLQGEGNTPLPLPPAGVWRGKLAAGDGGGGENSPAL